MRSPRMVAALGATLALLLAAPAAALAVSDVSATVADSPDPVTAGTNLTYTVTLTNTGPDAASSAVLMDTLPAGTTFVSASVPAGWSCTTPAVGAGGTVTCSQASMPVGVSVATLVVAVDGALADGTILANSATLLAADDANGANDTGTATTTVVTSADLAATIADAPDPASVGQDVVYGVDLAQHGPSDANTVGLTIPLPGDAAFRSLSAPGGWSCTVPAVDATSGTVTCTRASLAIGTSTFTLVLRPTAAAAGGTVSLTATASATTSDPDATDNAATATTTVNPLPTPPGAGSTFRRPTVTAVTPASGPAGRAVVISGDGFAGTTAVRFGDRAASFVVDGHGRITAVVPDGVPGATVDVRVTNPAGTSLAAPGARYTFESPAADPPAPPTASEPPVVCARVPDLVGRRMKGAHRALRRAGCEAAPMRLARGSKRNRGATIRSQTPSAGAALHAGEAIVVRLR